MSHLFDPDSDPVTLWRTLLCVIVHCPTPTTTRFHLEQLGRQQRSRVATRERELQDMRATPPPHQLVVNDSVFPFDIHVGVPQGSPLSPTLFLVFVDDLLQDLEQLVRLQAFADDILLWDITTYRGPCPPRVQ